MEEKDQDEVNRMKKGADCTGKVMLLCEQESRAAARKPRDAASVLFG